MWAEEEGVVDDPAPIDGEVRRLSGLKQVPCPTSLAEFMD